LLASFELYILYPVNCVSELIDALGIGLAIGRLHDLADEKVEPPFHSSAEFGNLGQRWRRLSGSDDLLDGATVEI